MADHLLPASDLPSSDDVVQTGEIRYPNSSLDITPVPVLGDREAKTAVSGVPEHGLSSTGETGTLQNDDHIEQLDSLLTTGHDSESDRPSMVTFGKEEERQLEPWTQLYRSGYVFLLAFVYAGLVVFAWAVTCILVHRPIGTKLQQYGEWQLRLCDLV